MSVHKNPKADLRRTYAFRPGRHDCIAAGVDVGIQHEFGARRGHGNRDVGAGGL